MNWPLGLWGLKKKKSPKLQLTFSWAKYLADKMTTWLLAQPETWLRVEMAPCTASGERESSWLWVRPTIASDKEPSVSLRVWFSEAMSRRSALSYEGSEME